MARSHAVLKSIVWEPGSDFRDLSPLAQWAYVMLLSQPQISNLGILAYTPEKWTRLAKGLTVVPLLDALSELERSHFVLIDRDTAELLVRTFIQHDKVWSQPKLIISARKLIREVESAAIRDLLISRHPWLVNDWDKQMIKEFEDSDTPIDTPNERGIRHPLMVVEIATQKGPQIPLSIPLSKKTSVSNGAGDGVGESPNPETLVSSPPVSQPGNGHESHDSMGNHPRELALLHAACGMTDDALTKLKRTAKGCSQGDLIAAREVATGPGIRDPLAAALSELSKRKKARSLLPEEAVA